MLLVGAGQHEAFDQIAIRITHGAITIVDFLPLRSAVTAHGHPARIDDGPAFLRLVPTLALTSNRRQVGRPSGPLTARCDRVAAERMRQSGFRFP